MDRRLATDSSIFLALTAGAIVFYYVPRSLAPLALMLLAAYAALTYVSIRLAILPIILFVPYYSHPKVLLGFHFPVSEWLLAVVTAVALLEVCVSALAPALGLTAHQDHRALPARLRTHVPRYQLLFSTPFRLPALLFVLGAFISTVFASQHGPAARALLEVVLEPLALFAIILLFAPPDGIGDSGSGPSVRVTALGSLKSYVATLGMAVMTTGIVPSLIAIGQLLTHQHVVKISGAFYERVPGPYGSPDNLGLLLDRSIPMGLALSLMFGLWQAGKERSTSGPSRLFSGGQWGTIALGLGLGCMFIALLATFVLGAWLGTAFGVLMILLVRFRPGIWIAAPVVVMLVAGLALGLGKAHAITAGKRLDIWQSAIHMIHDHPIVGVGPDNFLHYYAPKRGDNVSPNAHNPSGQCTHGLGYMKAEADNEPCESHPHDLILDLWLSTGVVGLLAFGWLLYVFWQCIWTLRRELYHTPVLLGAAAAMLASLVHGLVDNGYFLIDLSLLFWVLLAIVSLLAKKELKSDGSETAKAFAAS